MRRVLGRGLTMVTLDELHVQLGPDVTDEMLRKWHTRYALHRVKLDGTWWYHLEGAIEIEWLTRESGRGRPRGSTKTADSENGQPRTSSSPG